MISANFCNFFSYLLSKHKIAAYKRADGKKIDGKRVLVDIERGRTIKGWRPRRLGGGKGGRKSHFDPLAAAVVSTDKSTRVEDFEDDRRRGDRENRDTVNREKKTEREREAETVPQSKAGVEVEVEVESVEKDPSQKVSVEMFVFVLLKLLAKFCSTKFCSFF